MRVRTVKEVQLYRLSEGFVSYTLPSGIRGSTHFISIPVHYKDVHPFILFHCLLFNVGLNSVNVV